MGMSRKELKILVEIQSLIGIAKSNYENDRDPNRAENVSIPLQKAFMLCLRMTAKYPPVM